jgi:peptide/nickel transport system permease protein
MNIGAWSQPDEIEQMSDGASGFESLDRPSSRRIPRPWSLRIGLGLIIIITLMTFIVPLVDPYTVNQFVALPFLPPSFAHPFGTDDFGRDVFVRTFAGGRIDIEVAVIGTIVPLIFGTLLGVASGLAKQRWIDSVIMRVTDAIIAFPWIIIILTIVATFGVDWSVGPLPPGLPSLFVALFVTGWAPYARLARAQTLSLKERDYISAAGLLGFSQTRIAIKEVLPNVIPATASYAVGMSILVVAITASLPFLGAGVQPPAPEWGAIMYEGSTFIQKAWWITVLPGVVVALFGYGTSLVADSLLTEKRT